MKFYIFAACSVAFAYTTAAATISNKHASLQEGSLSTKRSLQEVAKKPSLPIRTFPAPVTTHDKQAETANEFLAVASRIDKEHHTISSQQHPKEKHSQIGHLDFLQYKQSQWMYSEYPIVNLALLGICVATFFAALAICMSNIEGPITGATAEPQTLADLFESQTIGFKLPDTVFGDAVLQFAICGALFSIAFQKERSPPVAALLRCVLCFLLIGSVSFLTIFIAWNLDVKLAQERFGFRHAIQQCALPLATACPGHSPPTFVDRRFWPLKNLTLTPSDWELEVVDHGGYGGNCCTKDQVCGEMDWRYFCTDKTRVKTLYKDPYGTSIWGSMACSFQKVSETYYEYEDTVYPRWSWLVSSVLVVWLCIMARDARGSFLLLRAVTSRPRIALASNQIIQRGKELELAGLTFTTSAAIVFLVVIPKFFVCFYVAYVGGRLLISTSGVMDLVLDGVALTFLLEIEQMLFFGLIGSGMRDVLKSCKPMSFRVNSLSVRFVDLFGVDVSVITVTAAILLLIVYYVRNESKFMGRFIETNCRP